MFSGLLFKGQLFSVCVFEVGESPNDGPGKENFVSIRRRECGHWSPGDPLFQTLHRVLECLGM